MAEEFRVLRPLEYHSHLITKGQRADGRQLAKFRDVKLEIDAIRSANSSALVKIGNTSLVCGCTAEILKINSFSSDSYEPLKIKVELPPICSSNTNGFKAQQTAQLITTALRNILDDSGCLDKSSLLLPEHDSYWSVEFEIICLNYDGCLLDAALIAFLSALDSLRLNDEQHNVTHQKLYLNNTPICSSFAMIADKIVCDPNLEEENVASCLLSIAVDPNTNNCCHINKVGGKSMSADLLYKCIELAKTRASELKQLVQLDHHKQQMDCN